MATFLFVGEGPMLKGALDWKPSGTFLQFSSILPMLTAFALFVFPFQFAAVQPVVRVRGAAVQRWPAGGGARALCVPTARSRPQSRLGG